jgi:hypothetical protein
VLHPGRQAGIGQAATDGDDAAGEVALVELPVDAVDGHGGVASDATALGDGEGGAQALLVQIVSGTVGRLPERGGRAAEQACVRGLVVVLVEEGPQPDIDVVERRH